MSVSVVTHGNVSCDVWQENKTKTNLNRERERESEIERERERETLNEKDVVWSL